MTEPITPGRVHRGTDRFTFDEALHLVLCGTLSSRADGTAGREDAIDHAIAQRMVDTDCCLWHASFEIYTERYAAGLIPVDVCTVCGGRNLVGHGDHALCKVRAERGREIERLDVVDARRCDCNAPECIERRGDRR